MRRAIRQTMNSIDYWKECVSVSAEECGATLTDEQILCIAESVMAGHENYGMAYYSPPAGDRIAEVEREWKAKVQRLERDAEKYRENAEKAVKHALCQKSDEQISIGEDGGVFRHGGRTERIL